MVYHAFRSPAPSRGLSRIPWVYVARVKSFACIGTPLPERYTALLSVIRSFRTRVLCPAIDFLPAQASQFRDGRCLGKLDARDAEPPKLLGKGLANIYRSSVSAYDLPDLLGPSPLRVPWIGGTQTDEAAAFE